ncbi:MAG: hypothetical protein U1F49_06860 [Rubrivivax sp.]
MARAGDGLARAAASGDVCAKAAPAAGLACHRTRGGSAAVRQLDRPGIVFLRQRDEPPVVALLVALDERGATLQTQGRHWRLSLAGLATVWRGDFATLWRTPPGWRETANALPPAALERERARLGERTPRRRRRARHGPAAARPLVGLPGGARPAARRPARPGDDDAARPRQPGLRRAGAASGRARGGGGCGCCGGWRICRAAAGNAAAATAATLRRPPRALRRQCHPRQRRRRRQWRGEARKYVDILDALRRAESERRTRSGARVACAAVPAWASAKSRRRAR